jgi:hypothetical protein
MAETRGAKITWVIVGAVAFLVTAALVCFFVFGLGDAQVSGRVTLENEPVAGAQVVFLGEDEANQAPVPALTNDDGYYQLLGPKAGSIAVGKYKVVVNKMTLKDGTVPAGEQLNQARSKGLLHNSLPKVYEDRSTTLLQADVHPGPNTVNLELKKR